MSIDTSHVVVARSRVSPFANVARQSRGTSQEAEGFFWTRA